jgi:hypothetical protein
VTSAPPIIIIASLFWWRKKFCGSGGIRTRASEETGALNQRLRPLGHATLLDKWTLSECLKILEQCSGAIIIIDGTALMWIKEKCPWTSGALYVSKLTTNNNKLAWIAIWLFCRTQGSRQVLCYHFWVACKHSSARLLTTVRFPTEICYVNVRKVAWQCI